jgi:putative spermidine/putrescine transport system substrate-binding protein
MQLNYLEHYCHPARFSDLLKNGKIPQELLDKLPPAERYESAFLPTVEQLSQAKKIIIEKWDSVVGPIGQK